MILEMLKTAVRFDFGYLRPDLRNHRPQVIPEARRNEAAPMVSVAKGRFQERRRPLRVFLTSIQCYEM